MAPKKELFVEKCATIIAFYNVGFSIRQIISKENVSYGGVYNTT